MNIPPRIRAFLIHLGASIFIVTLVISLILYVWYPSPLASAQGTFDILKLLILIDVILGPLLTLIIYNVKKNSLKFDLTVVIIIQIMALMYGLFTLSQSRPVWLVQVNSMFQVVTANSVNESSQHNAKSEYQHNSWGKPRWIATDDQQAIQQLILEPAFYPEFYIPIQQANSERKSKAHTLEHLKEFNTNERVENVLRKFPTASQWMPLRTNGDGLVVLLDKNAKILGIVDLRPWN